jgi:hypothetical protein
VQNRPSDQRVGGPDWEKRLRLMWVGEGTRGEEAWRRAELTRSIAEVDALVDDAIGARRVLDAISASKVPVVGHNLFLDLGHCAAKFVGPLPENVCDFATQMKTLFPVIFDTKHLIAASHDATPDALLSVAFAANNSLSQA